MMTANTRPAAAHWIKAPGEYGAAEIEDLVTQGSEHFWLQYHQGRDLAGAGAHRIMVKGEGHYIYDIEGNRYLDAMAGLYLLNLGHSQADIVEAIRAQLTALPYANTGSYVTVAGIRLAERLAEKAPGDLDKVFFCNGGSEAVEIALKMAKQIQYLRGFPKKTKIVTRKGEYHGSTFAAMALTGRARYGGIFEPVMAQTCLVEQPNCARCPWGLNDGSVVAAGETPGVGCCMQAVRDLERLIEFEGAETIAAFIATPNGANDQLPPPGYWPAIRALCDKHDILLIADEVIAAFGRLGRWFGMERWGIVPDIMTLAKGMTAGYQPCGAVIARRQWADLFEEKEAAFHHGVTYGSHPAVMAAGLATLDVMEREGVVENSDRLGPYLYEQAMERLHDRHPTVGFVGGGMGLMITVNMVKSRRTMESFDAEYTKSLTEKVRQRGMATRAGDEIWIAPPLTFTKPEIDQMLEILDDAITAQEREYPSED
jgi:adenosylmethionine-8-amino-7-oxononanoate aminotransferase